MNPPNALDSTKVLAYIERRFPREYEIALQAVYIHSLEEAAGISRDDQEENGDSE